jgi:hypothetical protein
VAEQRLAQRCGCSLVEKNLHQFQRDWLAPSGRDQALLGVPQHALGLRAGHPGKPLEEIIHPCPTFQVFEQSLTGTRVPLKTHAPLTFSGVRSAAAH